MALEVLSLRKLPSLIWLSKEDGESIFPRLSTLRIDECPTSFLSTGFQYLTRLEELCIKSCREVEGLHEALQHMTALKELELRNLPNLKSLPDCFGSLPFLRYLNIVKFLNRTCLPTSLSLSRSLEWLTISGRNSELEKRCENEKGEDRPKIAHIPRIDIMRHQQDGIQSRRVRFQIRAHEETSVGRDQVKFMITSVPWG